VSTSISYVLKEEILATTAYQVAEAGDLLKLDAMESPYILNGELKEAWLKKLSMVAINRYPDPQCRELKGLLQQRLKLDDALDVVFGNGSDELIQILIQAAAKPGAKVLAPAPSFVMYENVCQWHGVEFLLSDLDGDFQLDIDYMLEQIAAQQPALIFLAQPNNPTGNNWQRSDIARIVEAAKGLVVIDEAYVAYSDDDFLDFASKYSNVALLRTFSKQGFAGIRLGALIANNEWVEQLNKVRMPYNVSSLTQATGTFLLEHWDYFSAQADEIVQERAWLSAELSAMGLHVYPSQANFLVVKSGMLGLNLVKSLSDLGVLIKNLCGSHPLLRNCVRITVSTRSENAQLLAALEHVLAERA